MPGINMSEAMRSRRREMLDYMYRGGATDDPAQDPEADPAAEPAPTFTVVDAGQPTNEDESTSFVYEPFEGSEGVQGAWVVYPPGVPCDQEERRVIMDHPATPEEFDRMAEAIKAGGKTTPEPETPAEDTGEGYTA